MVKTVRVWAYFVVTLFSLFDSCMMQCTCGKPELCEPAQKFYKSQPEVFVFSRESAHIYLWNWKSFDTLIVPPSFEKRNIKEGETLCITRSRGKRFGITVEFDITDDTPGMLNQSSENLTAWHESTIEKQKDWGADVVTIDLLPYFKLDRASRKEDHTILAVELAKLRKAMKDIEILCVVPWKPPCARQDGSCDFVFLVRDACDHFVVNPDSFLDTTGSKCVARASIPFSKVIYGIVEYQAHFVPSSRIILGVSWHGYDYTCSSLVNDVCQLAYESTNDTDQSVHHSCDYGQRKRLTHGDIIQHHPIEYVRRHQDIKFDSPFFNYKDETVSHQVWFEDRKSLKDKYMFVHELKLKGIAVLYGDDLFPTKSTSRLMTNDELMWSWLSHELYLQSARSPEHHDLHWPKTVAGVAVGCLLLGVVLGVIFTCIGLQKRVRKPREPFRRDNDPLSGDYVDDPDL